MKKIKPDGEMNLPQCVACFIERFYGGDREEFARIGGWNTMEGFERDINHELPDTQTLTRCWQAGIDPNFIFLKGKSEHFFSASPKGQVLKRQYVLRNSQN